MALWAHATYDIMLEAGGNLVIRYTRRLDNRRKALSSNDFILVKCVEGSLGCGVNMGKSVEWKLGTHRYY